MQFIKKINKKIFLTAFILIIIFVVGIISIAVYDTQSKVIQVVNYKPNIALKILDRKDRLIANVFENEFRYYANFDEIPPKVIETLLAVEDTMFFEHSGINLDAIMRAMLKNIKSGGLNEGGSTITQQLVKNISLTKDRTIDRKLKEAVITLQVEKLLNKEEILEKYLNYIFLGNGFYGIKTAAYGYFDKELSNLTLKEIAMLMALPKAPSYYNPITNFQASIARANTIIERLYSLGWIDKNEYETALKETPKVYNKTLTQNLAPYIVDEVLKQLTNIKDLKTGGYIVKLNIDLDYQQVAQNALNNGYNNIIKRLDSRNKKENKETNIESLNGAIVVTQSKTGNILALVGGIDYTKSNFNRATQAKRQFGSTVKPFIYQIAFDMGYSQATLISDVARSFGQKEVDLTKSQALQQNDEDVQREEEEEVWRPKNYTRSFNGLVPLKKALRLSLNLATVNLVDMIGFRKVYNEMNNYGFNNIPQDMSIALGSFVLSPLEAAKYYSIFANYGSMVEPKIIRSIINPNNEEIFKQDESNSTLITEPSQAYLTIDILKEVVNTGTGYRAKTPGIEIAGKTGTSNQNIDSWFSGFSPTLQVVVWYGRDDNTPIGSNETGGVISAPVVNDFFKNILKIEPGLKRNFDIPENTYKRTINGIEYYYTDKSKLPNTNTNFDNEFIF
ncbi:penicillin-binding protein [Helicobacter sp. MIT 14-3879]|nr:PBP1A family penicillin-binding protein [Helicobacter sp. MIT 14-3879]RDU64675.1 penicillin-binding protein [Helicobacter sp. MIT 14-3879]